MTFCHLPFVQAFNDALWLWALFIIWFCPYYVNLNSRRRRILRRGFSINCSEIVLDVTLTDEYRHREGGKTVTLEVFQSEPLARMAASRLEAEGIRCMVRSLGAGPGLWGLAANVPHALDTWEEDAVQAREVLNLMPAEIEERTREPLGGGTSLPKLIFLVLLVLVAGALVVQLADAAFGRLLG